MVLLTSTTSHRGRQTCSHTPTAGRSAYGGTSYPNDLAVPLEEAAGFQGLFAGYLLRAIHCTRLLDHERTWVLEQGLRVASSELIEERIRGACTNGSISNAERDALLGAHALVNAQRAQHQSRAGQVCFVGSRTTLDRVGDFLELRTRPRGSRCAAAPRGSGRRGASPSREARGAPGCLASDQRRVLLPAPGYRAGGRERARSG